ncbi:MAG: HesA/MoeB/ThiF family protein [Gammaproteobacteria bacterium]|nr:MAG: HesA/MoeB/ThiF family protein [Gammaproteobacteria bacterium]
MHPGRHARHLALPALGPEGIARLTRARVLLVGLGGLGCPAAQYLAAAGVGTLLLNDFDRVDLSNLARQVLYTPADEGRRKVAVAAERLAALNPDITLERIDQRLAPAQLQTLASGCDLVLDASDNLATRLAVNAACVAVHRPLITASVIRLEGQLLVSPNDGSTAPCYQCVYDERDESLGDCRGAGVLGPVAGMLGTLMATEALKLLAGLPPVPGMLLVDAAGGQFRRLRARRDPECPACGTAAQRSPAHEPLHVHGG